MHGIIWYNSEKNILQLLSEIPKNRPGPIGLKFWIWCCVFPNNM